jgi:predicted transcriptional regulator
MGQTTVRVTESTREVLRRLAAAEGRPMQTIIATALEAYQREQFLRAINAGYATVRADAAAWARVAEERAAWDGALLDGLGRDTVGARPGKVSPSRRRRGRGHKHGPPQPR